MTQLQWVKTVRVVLPAWAGVFTFVTFQRGDGGVRLLLQLQQRDLARVIADEGVLRLVVVSEPGSQGLKHGPDVTAELLGVALLLKDTVGRRPRR